MKVHMSISTILLIAAVAVAVPHGRRGQCADPVRSMVRVGITGQSESVSRLTFSPAVVTPEAAPTRAFTVPQLSISTEDFALTAGVLAGALLLVLVGSLVLHVLKRLDSIAEGQERLSTAQASLLDVVAAMSGSGLSQRPASTGPAETTHGMASSVGHEVLKMSRRLKQLPQGLPQARALTKALERLVRTLKQHGYTVRDLTGQRYTEGMRVNVAEFVPFTQPGTANTIQRTLKPEVRYKGKVIQPATVMVSTDRPRMELLETANPKNQIRNPSERTADPCALRSAIRIPHSAIGRSS